LDKQKDPGRSLPRVLSSLDVAITLARHYSASFYLAANAFEYCKRRANLQLSGNFHSAAFPVRYKLRNQRRLLAYTFAGFDYPNGLLLSISVPNVFWSRCKPNPD
jgi:hypothetical protein